jgi:hypothetical protein
MNEFELNLLYYLRGIDIFALDDSSPSNVIRVRHILIVKIEGNFAIVWGMVMMHMII